MCTSIVVKHLLQTSFCSNMVQDTLLVIRGGIILCDQLCLWKPCEERALATVDVISDILVWRTKVCSSFM
jgi:hypothetical protein